jgi:hypothetical protein
VKPKGCESKNTFYLENPEDFFVSKNENQVIGNTNDEESVVLLEDLNNNKEIVFVKNQEGELSKFCVNEQRNCIFIWNQSLTLTQFKLNSAQQIRSFKNLEDLRLEALAQINQFLIVFGLSQVSLFEVGHSDVTLQKIIEVELEELKSLNGRILKFSTTHNRSHIQIVYLCQNSVLSFRVIEIKI